MKISKIEKKKRLYKIEMSDQSTYYVTEDTIVRFMLSKDKEISLTELDQIQNFAQFSHGKNLALYFLSFQNRTSAQVKDYLTKHAIEAAIIPDIIANLEADNWLNDEQYIANYLRQNTSSGDKGPLVIKQKLQQKGLNKEQIEAQLSAIDFEPIAKKLAQHLQSKYANKYPVQAQLTKIKQQLRNKGFSYALIQEVTDSLAFASDDEQSAQLLAKDFEKLYRNYRKKYEGFALHQKLFQGLYRKGYDSDDIKAYLRQVL
ncbi:recombination regulator RecX [Streptococcus halichoeri]|uniref:recombination regulator RecX n=1 Tax=Streptococcus halichoeri TaxID=254785 RepID=UPI001359DDED|nr:recombination regulator RecX [Streptococcus halichoeri]